MWHNDDDEICSLYSPLLPPIDECQYGTTSTNTAIRIMHRSPLTTNSRASISVQVSNTFYRNGKPFIECYEVRIMSSTKMLAYPLSKGIWRTYKEFCWLRNFLKKEYSDQKIPHLPPNYLFRKNYDQEVVTERIQGLQDFLRECLENKHILSDEAFHLFTQSNSTIEEIKKQQPNNNHPSLLKMCFWVCQNNTQEAVVTIDYGDFKKELESVLLDNNNESLYSN